MLNRTHTSSRLLAFAKDPFVISFLLAAICLISNTSGYAQQATGNITGTVSNERDELIAGATVIIESSQLSIKRTTTTNEQGYFSVSNLPVGLYNVEIDASGFSKFVQQDIKLDVGSNFNVIARLKVGSLGETVVVTDQPYQAVNTHSANVETLISGTQITELSLNGRNWSQLLTLAPGTTSHTQGSDEGTRVRIDDVAINGLRRRTAPTLDGANNVDHGSVGTQVNNISVDAIQEFKLVSSPYSAEYGAQAGPAINVVTKRGTTEYHGSLFEFFRHDKLNAFRWEQKQSLNPEKPHLRFNNFGGFIGGPVPSLKNRLFFFGGAEWKRPRVAQPVNGLVPTDKMRVGDFSELLSLQNPEGGTVYDKSGPIPVPFAGNFITKPSQNGLALIKLYPRANAYSDRGLLERYVAAPVRTQNIRQDVARVDYQVNQFATLYVRWLRDSFVSHNPLGSTFDNQIFPIAPDNHTRLGKTLLANYTQVISPTLVNELSFSWQRNDQAINYLDPSSIDRSAYGVNFPELFLENRLNKIPEIRVDGYPTITGGGLPYDIKVKNLELRDNLIQTLGGHTLKYGLLMVGSYKSENFRTRDGGTISFRHTTGSDPTSGQSSGVTTNSTPLGTLSTLGLANLVLGAYNSYEETSTTTNAPTFYDQAEFYINDQWRINSHLTLTIGLRFQYIPWPTAQRHNIVGFDPRRFDPAKAPIRTDISSGRINLRPDPTGQRTRAEGFYDPYNGIVLPGNNLTGDSSLDRLFDNRRSGLADSGNVKLAPRFGFAYDPKGDGKLSIRGGAGIYYDRTLLNPVRDASQNVPFAQVAQLPGGRQDATPTNLFTQLANTLDTVGIGVASPRIQQLNVFDLNMPPGAVYAYSLGIQRELPWAAVMDISYVGNQARHLTHRRDINYVLPEIALSPQFLRTQRDTIRQFLGYSEIRQQENTGSSSYNSLQTSLQKRLSRGLTASAAYTWSKSLANFDTETDDLRVPFNSRLDKSLAEFDRRHVFTTSFVYELPWLKKQNSLLGKAFGGWQLSGSGHVQSGRRFNISGGSAAGTAPSNGYINLDLIGDWKAVPGGQRSSLWINRSAFTSRRGLIGTLPKNLIEMPATHVWNLSLMKRIVISEEIKLQFRAEAFNLFNRANFRNISTNVTASNFGQFIDTEDPRVFQFGLKLLF